MQRSSIFKWFAAMCNTMTADELPPYLMPVVAPIYRTVNDEQNKVAGFGKYPIFFLKKHND